MSRDHSARKGMSFLRHWDSEVLILQGESRPALIEQGRQVRRYVARAPGTALRDLAYTLNSRLAEVPWRLAIVASSLADVEAKLVRAVGRLEDAGCTQIKDRSGIYFFEEPLGRQGKLAFLFPGEGSQYVNMLSDLCIYFPEVRACFDLADRAFVNSGRDEHLPSRFIFPPPDGRAEESGLWRMEGAVAAVTTTNRALLTLLSRLEIQPEALLGHSTGEFTALQAAGIMDLHNESLYEQCVADLDGIYTRVATEEGVPRAAMVAVGADAVAVSQIIAQGDGGLYIAMDNCPHQTVLVGHKGAVDRVIGEMRDRGVIYEVLLFDRPYHTPLFEAYAGNLHPFFERWLTSPPEIPLYSCTTMGLYPSDVAQIRELALEHWVRPVEFRKTIEAMYAGGVRIFVEVGPRGNLTAFVDDILGRTPHLAVPSNIPARSGIAQLHHLVALLAAHGVDMRLDHLYARRAPQKLSVEAEADRDSGEAKIKRSMKLALGLPILQVKTRDASVAPEDRYGESVEPSRAAPSDPRLSAGQGMSSARQSSIGDSPGVGHQGAANSRHRVLQAYFQTMTHFLEAQQEVMQAFLANSRAVRASDSAITGVEATISSPTEASWDPESARIELEPSQASFTSAPQGPVPDQGQRSQQKTDHRVHGSVAPPVASEVGLLEREEVIGPASPEVGEAASERIGETLLRLVSDRTGYPLEMLDLALDLEADLGIDSIKRVEILGALQQETGAFETEALEQVAGLKTLQEMIVFLTAGCEPASRTAASSRDPAAMADGMPLIGAMVSLVPGRELVARREISLEEDLFLEDHTLGREISVMDGGLSGLPVVPLTMSMEMMAEAAALLLPDRLPIGMKDIRAQRWICLDDRPIALEITARRGALREPEQVEVQIREADDSTGLRGPIVEGKVIFGDRYPQPPPVEELRLRSEQPCEYATPGRFYPKAMFHGPGFQGVVSVDRWGENGAEASVRGLSARGLFRSVPNPSFLTDPVLLDALGQVVGFWIANFPTAGFVAFPFAVEALHIYGPGLGPGERATCQARIAVVGEERTRADIDLVGQDGRLRMRLVGWEDTGFDMPRAFFGFILAPGEVVISSPWPKSLAGFPAPAFHCRRLDGFPRDFFEAHGMIWKRALAHLVLSRREWEIWRNLSGPPKRRTEWLLGRVVAKEVVRLFVQDHYGTELRPADIEIMADEQGRPVVEGLWTEGLQQVPILSLAHSDGVAVAMAGDSGDGKGVGIDMERVGRVREEAIQGLAFTLQEQELLASMEETARDEWALRVWCAKEAVSKALGLGMIGGPQSLAAQALEVSSGKVEITVTGRMAQLDPRLAGSCITAHTICEGDWVFAASLYERR